MMPPQLFVGLCVLFALVSAAVIIFLVCEDR